MVGMAGALGYWYRDVFEPQIPTLQTQPDNPSQATRLPQITPLKDQSSITPDSKPQNQNLLLKKDERLRGQPQPLPTEKDIERRPQSNLTPLPNQSGIKPDKPGSTQPLPSPQTKQGNNLVLTGKQANGTLTPVPSTPHPIVRTPAGSTNNPLSPKASKTVPRQQPTAFTPTKETMHPKTESAQFSAPSEEIHDELTDEKIEALLQSLDDPTIDISSITKP